MEPDGSLKYLQAPVNCPLPEPAWSSSYPPPTHPTSWRPILILSFHLRLGFPSDTFEFIFIIIIIIIHGFRCYNSLPRPESSLSLYLQTIQHLECYKMSKPPI